MWELRKAEKNRQTDKGGITITLCSLPVRRPPGTAVHRGSKASVYEVGKKKQEEDQIRNARRTHSRSCPRPPRSPALELQSPGN